MAILTKLSLSQPFQNFRIKLARHLSGLGGVDLLNQFGDQSGPAGLVIGAESCPVVAMEVFVKQDVILPVRVTLELFRAAKNRTLPILISQKEICQPPRNLFRHLTSIHHLAGPSRTFNLEVIAQEVMELLQ
jgi:hypothetical protein